MPADTSEVAKIVIESSGPVSVIWQWIIGGIGGIVVAMWRHIIGRIKKIEREIVTAEICRSHLADEREKFAVLFRKTEQNAEKLAQIAESVARIEGKLDQ